jgi:hypothetical protein
MAQKNQEKKKKKREKNGEERQTEYEIEVRRSSKIARLQGEADMLMEKQVKQMILKEKQEYDELESHIVKIEQSDRLMRNRMIEYQKQKVDAMLVVEQHNEVRFR